jgi:hypothetical protein
MWWQTIGSQSVQELLGVVAIWVVLCTVKAMVDYFFSLKMLYHAYVYLVDVVVRGGEECARSHVIRIRHVVI